MKVRIPKDISKYIPSKIAAARLMYVALENILCVRDGISVKWELKVRYYYPQDVMDRITSPCIAMGKTFTSGPWSESNAADGNLGQPLKGVEND